MYECLFIFMVKPHQANAKANAKATSLYWVHSISSLPATPNVARNWVQNPLCRDFATEIAFALVWPDH